MEQVLLSLLVWMPILGGFATLIVGNERALSAKWVALSLSVIVFILSLGLYTGFDNTTHLMQFVEKSSWISQFNINYHLGVDGISMPLIFLLLSQLFWLLLLVGRLFKTNLLITWRPS